MAWQTFNVTFQDTGNTVTLTGHGLNSGDIVYFTSIVSTTGIVASTNYYVVNTTENTFKLSLTLGGSVIDLVTNGTGVLHFIPIYTAKDPALPYIILQGVSAKTDIGNGMKGWIRAFNVLGVEPVMEPLSEPVKKIGGVVKASRVDITKLNVKFAEFKVDVSANNNDFTDYLYLVRHILKQEYIAIVATNLTRGGVGDPFSTDYINIPIEPIERSKNAVFDNQSDDLTIVFQEREIGSIV